MRAASSAADWRGLEVIVVVDFVRDAVRVDILRDVLFPSSSRSTETSISLLSVSCCGAGDGSLAAGAAAARRDATRVRGMIA
jgi:hypothetical protein